MSGFTPTDSVKTSFTVDPELCIACNACIKEAPHSFAMDTERGTAFAKRPSPRKHSHHYREAYAALELCPVGAIAVQKNI